MNTSNLTISYNCVTNTNPLSSTMDWFSWLSKTTLEPSLIYDYGLTFARNELQLEDAIHFNHEFLQSMGISIAKHRLEILKLVKKEEGPKKLSGVIKKCLKKCMSKFVSRENKDMSLPLVLTPEPNWYQGKWKSALVKKQGSEDVKEEKHVPPIPMYRSRTMPYSGPLDGRMHEKMVNNKAMKLSGPIDGRLMNERMVYTNRSPLITSRNIDGRFTGTIRSPRVSGPLDATARMMLENRSPRRLTRPSAKTESPMGYKSPYNKPKADFDHEDDDDDDADEDDDDAADDDIDDHTLWPALFQDMKPT